MTDQTHFTQLNSPLPELATARGNLLSEISGLTRFIRAITERLPRSPRLRRDIGLTPFSETPEDIRDRIVTGPHQL